MHSLALFLGLLYFDYNFFYDHDVQGYSLMTEMMQAKIITAHTAMSALVTEVMCPGVQAIPRSSILASSCVTQTPRRSPCVASETGFLNICGSERQRVRTRRRECE